ncbi:MAG: TlpA disulfide reductase family protein [Vicinamibacterales bacterium]
MAVVALVLGSGALNAQTPSPAGLWDATIVTAAGLEVPFKFEITQKGGVLAGGFFDGDLRVWSTSGSVENGRVTLAFAQYGSRIEATFSGTGLAGRYDRGTRGASYPFNAVRAAGAPASGRVPRLAGEYRIPLTVGPNKGENSWRLLLRQNGAEISGAIMRVDGDTGTLSGTFKNGTVLLSHFAGAGPTVIEVTPQADRSLVIVEDRRNRLVAYPVADERAKAVPPLADPTRYTSVRNRAEKFRFSFPDLDGRLVSDTDARFHGKVVIVSVTGSWCPNCHDEAPFLSKLYRDYRAKGLEIVALAFEEADQLKNPSRVRGFVKQYGLTYPFLLAGLPEEAPEKIPQAVNLRTFPATFILGRDGRVKAVHAGYASKATGQFYVTEQRRFVAEVEQLLAEK